MDRTKADCEPHYQRQICMYACSPNELPEGVIKHNASKKKDGKLLARWEEVVSEPYLRWPDYNYNEAEDFGHSYCGDDWLAILEKIGVVRNYKVLSAENGKVDTPNSVCYGFSTDVWPLVKDVVWCAVAMHGSNVGDVVDINEEWGDDIPYVCGLSDSPEKFAKYGFFNDERLKLTYDGKTSCGEWERRIGAAHNRHETQPLYREKCPDLGDNLWMSQIVFDRNKEKIFVDLRRFYSLPEWQVITIVAHYLSDSVEKSK